MQVGRYVGTYLVVIRQVDACGWSVIGTDLTTLVYLWDRTQPKNYFLSTHHPSCMVCSWVQFRGGPKCLHCLPGSHGLLQLLWWLRLCFSGHVCCFAMRLTVFGVLYFLLQEWERCDWGLAFILTCTIPLLQLFLASGLLPLPYFCHEFFSFAKVVLYILCQFHEHSLNQVTKCLGSPKNAGNVMDLTQ